MPDKIDQSTIYFDYNSTTPVEAEVLEFMLPWMSTHFGNAASRTHITGRMAGDAVEKARESLAKFIGASPQEIVFTSGSTESINLAIKGVAAAYKQKGNHIITWQSEHKAVLDTCKNLEANGYEITYLPVSREGLPDLHQLETSITVKTILVAMMMVNNETGVVMPVADASKIAHAKGCLFFTDATQAAGKTQIDVNSCGADLLCISSHKMYGPKGSGLLFVRRKDPRVSLVPMIHGGGHENGLRSGTLNVPGILGMQKAAEICDRRYWDDTSMMSKLRTILEQELTDNQFGNINGSIRDRVANTTNICFPGIRASELITKVPNIEFAAGSACSSALPSPSHVLTAMGLTEKEAHASARFSIGRGTTMEDIFNATSTLKKGISELRSY